MLLAAIKSWDVTVDIVAFYPENNMQLRGNLSIKGDDPEKRMSYQRCSRYSSC